MKKGELSVKKRHLIKKGMHWNSLCKVVNLFKKAKMQENTSNKQEEVVTREMSFLIMFAVASLMVLSFGWINGHLWPRSHNGNQQHYPWLIGLCMFINYKK